jgi:hypothetical protein
MRRLIERCLVLEAVTTVNYCLRRCAKTSNVGGKFSHFELTCAVVATEMLERGKSPLSRPSKRKLNMLLDAFKINRHLPERFTNVSAQVNGQAFESSPLIFQHL